MIAERRCDTCDETVREGAAGPAAPLPVPITGPVTCRRCGGVFGRGAEAGTVCPYCGGALGPLRAGAPAGGGAA